MKNSGLAALLLLFATSASAAQPPPDYRATLLGAVSAETQGGIDHLMEDRDPLM